MGVAELCVESASRIFSVGEGDARRGELERILQAFLRELARCSHRDLGRLASFETASFNHSDTSPRVGADSVANESPENQLPCASGGRAPQRPRAARKVRMPARYSKAPPFDNIRAQNVPYGVCSPFLSSRSVI